MTESVTLAPDFRSIVHKRIMVKFLARPKVMYNGAKIGTIGEFKEMRCERKYLDCLREHYEIKDVKVDNES